MTGSADGGRPLDPPAVAVRPVREVVVVERLVRCFAAEARALGLAPLAFARLVPWAFLAPDEDVRFALR